MFYFKAVDFLVSYDVFVLSAVFVAVWIFGIANWCKNVYRRQNKKLETCRANVLRNPKFAGIFVATLPEDYRRQWRAYVNSNASRPSLVFEFVPKRNKVVCVHLFVLCAVVSTLYLALFVFLRAHVEYVVFQFAFWLAFALVMVVDKLVFLRKEKRAKQIFGKFVAQLNAIGAQNPSDGKTVAEKLSALQKNGNGNALEKASKILRDVGLENQRTAQEQRAINTALNGLLQSYANAPRRCGSYAGGD